MVCTFALSLLLMLFLFLIATHSTPCEVKLKGSQGVITSPSSWKGNLCRRLIEVPLKHRVRLSFTSFLLDYAIRTSWVKIWDNKSPNGTLLGKYRGTMRPFTVESSDRYMFIQCRRTRLLESYYFKGVYTSVTAISKFQIVIYPLCSAICRRV